MLSAALVSIEFTSHVVAEMVKRDILQVFRHATTMSDQTQQPEDNINKKNCDNKSDHPYYY